ncbi:hypothetical protein [Saccharopolyspora mangrovi]|uniref:Uncharacterized protein n=1 Tax=Saccharopolyspora mangrovi TaxID=3082379 RepID=A0ABU6A944_9PSEU|nr:hypothetical protein [Saccharopolyspora sp. S2-29]MEB3368046.1 hypothetical protein [Saccharopolyspora sp. S2-29]
MELLVLMFVCGLAVATLVFWPLLNRANRKATESQQASSRGRHALGAATAPAAGSEKTESSGSEIASKPEEEKESSRGDGEATQPVKVEVTAPRPREPEPMEMPELPTDIFEARYQAKFNRSKRRLERIRSEISKTG